MTEVQTTARASSEVYGNEQISLVDLLDRLLGTGGVLSGDIVISLAGVDLVQVRLNALICTIREDMPPPGGWTARD